MNVAALTTNKHFKKIIVITFFMLSLLTWLGYQLYHHYYVSTEDAYINANIVQISPRSTGRVITLAVSNNQHVNKDDVLFEIDPEPFQLAVNAARAALELSLAELENAAVKEKRALTLVNKHYLSPQEGDNAKAQLKISMAKVEQAKSDLAQAELNLSYTKVTAPTSGWVTNFTVRVGNVVSANQPLFALISDSEFWVDANFKETEMQAIRTGQSATIITDMYPGKLFKGKVQSISGGAGSAFSLLPPQNATGNWVKVTQRVPVKVTVLELDREHPLRIGTSATVKIEIR